MRLRVLLMRQLKIGCCLAREGYAVLFEGQKKDSGFGGFVVTVVVAEKRGADKAQACGMMRRR
jgi:hypothetical protein